MGDIFNSGKKFSGDLSAHLPPRREEPHDRWADRLRHAWFVYLLAAILGPLWVGCLVVTILDAVWWGSGVGFLSSLVVFAPLVVYMRLVQYRILFSRDPDTGEKLGQQK